MSTIDIGGQQYRLGTLDAMTQFHVARRLLPVLTTMGISVSDLQGGMDADFMAIAGPVADVVAKMSNADVEFIINSCLAQVSRQITPDKWAPVMASNGRLMFQDLRMPDMLRLTIEVVKENMGSFFGELPGLG